VFVRITVLHHIPLIFNGLAAVEEGNQEELADKGSPRNYYYHLTASFPGQPG